MYAAIIPVHYNNHKLCSAYQGGGEEQGVGHFAKTSTSDMQVVHGQRQRKSGVGYKANCESHDLPPIGVFP